jgi:hypothetical protein
MSVFVWMANSTEPVAVFPVLSVTVNVAVKLSAGSAGVPVTSPVTALVKPNPVGRVPPTNAQVSGAVPPVAARVEV